MMPNDLPDEIVQPLARVGSAGVAPFRRTNSEERSGSCDESIILLLVDMRGVIESRVEADSVVPAFNEGEYGATGGLALVPDVQIDELVFQSCKE